MLPVLHTHSKMTAYLVDLLVFLSSNRCSSWLHEAMVACITKILPAFSQIDDIS